MSQPTIQPGRTPQLTPNPNRFPSSHYGPRLGQKRKFLPVALALLPTRSFQIPSRQSDWYPILGDVSTALFSPIGRSPYPEPRTSAPKSHMPVPLLQYELIL